MSVRDRVRAIQDYLDALEYNHTGFQFFMIDKRDPMQTTAQVADAIMAEALPIKCLEACAVAMVLTCGTPGLVRSPLRFRSVANGRRYWHIVCLLEADGAFGALGLSRQKSLGYRPIHFPSVTALVQDYVACYERLGHHVDRVTLGTPFSHRMDTQDPVIWSAVTFPIAGLSPESLSRHIAAFYSRARPRRPLAKVQRQPAGRPRRDRISAIDAV
ncbi:Vasohibin [Plasmodiophora brassicae]|nr:hypothetical protein PBRA_005514 [Plasmodiophora brassicae]